jgi:hypothetical protein
MTESDWEASADPVAMLYWALRFARRSLRKRALFARGLAGLTLARTGGAARDAGLVETVDNVERLAESGAPGASLTWEDWPDAGNMAAIAVARARGHIPEQEQCALLRCVFGNSFRPAAFDPAWRTPLVVSLAESAYAERLLPSGELDPQRLAVLADALEEAGGDGELLGHLRGPGLHVRGCWAVDLVARRG